MSVHENGEYADALGIEINDEEGLVDKKTKQHILNLRVEIDNDERELFVNWPRENPRQFSQVQAVQQWAISVKQYLRAIKRLWHQESRDNQVRNVDHYWRERTIAQFELVPPDKDGYEFRLIGVEGMGKEDVRNELNLPRDAEIPTPTVISIDGLQDILTRDSIGHTWSVYTDKTGAKPNWEQMVLRKQMPVPKSVLEEAVEVADDFLQQAGIGFKIGDDLPSWGYEELGSAIEDDDIEVV